MAGLFASDPGAPIVLDALSLPARSLDAGWRESLNTTRKVLTTEGEAAFGVRLLEPCVLGWAALCGVAPGESLLAAGLQVAIDYCACAETLGLTIDNWRSRFARALELARAQPDAPALEVLEAAWAASEGAAAEREAAKATRRQAKQTEEVTLTVAKGELAKTLTDAADGIKPVHTPRAQGLRNGLRKLAKQVMGSRSDAGLQELRAVATPVLTEALRMRQDADATTAEKKRQDAAAAQATKRQGVDARNRAAAQKQARAQAKADLKPVRKAISELKRLHARKSTRPGESPLAALRALRLPDGRTVIERVPAPASKEPPPGKGVLGFLVDVFDDPTAPVPTSWWCSTLDPGIVVGSPGLERWGPGTQRLLTPPLAWLYAWEDQLVPITGGRSRVDRPELAGGSGQPLRAARGIGQGDVDLRLVERRGGGYGYG